MRGLILIVVAAVLGMGAARAAAVPVAQGAGSAIMQAAGNAEPTTRPESALTNLAEKMKETRIGRVASGQQQLTVHDLLDVSFWFDSIQGLVIALISFIPRILVAMLFLVLFWIIYRMVRRVVLGSMGKAHVDQSIRDMLGHLIKWSVMGFGLVIACNQIGVQITALLTGVSIIGIAIGFAAQETLANFIAGIVIFWDKPFRVGEWVTVDNHYSKVSRVTFRSTRLLNHEGQTLVFPNTYMLSNRVVNHSSHPMGRVGVAISIAYSASLAEARKVLLAILEGDSRIASQPKPEVVVEECAASGVNLMLRFWSPDESLLSELRHEYLEKAKLALDAAGIEIPFPQMQVTMLNGPGEQGGQTKATHKN